MVDFRYYHPKNVRWLDWISEKKNHHFIVLKSTCYSVVTSLIGGVARVTELDLMVDDLTQVCSVHFFKVVSTF